MVSRWRFAPCKGIFSKSHPTARKLYIPNCFGRVFAAGHPGARPPTTRSAPVPGRCNVVKPSASDWRSALPSGHCSGRGRPHSARPARQRVLDFRLRQTSARQVGGQAQRDPAFARTESSRITDISRPPESAVAAPALPAQSKIVHPKPPLAGPLQTATKRTATIATLLGSAPVPVAVSAVAPPPAPLGAADSSPR